MANCGLLLNDGTSFVLLNDGISAVLLNDESCSVEPGQGGASDTKGGRITGGTFTRKKWKGIVGDIETQRILEAEARFVAQLFEQEERQKEIDRVRADIRKRLDEDERQARAETSALSVQSAQQALANAMMQQRMIEQMELQRKLIQDELDEEEDIIALLSMH
jgi:hypothetical protein